MEAGLASGLLNTSRQIGGALGVAILATVSATHTETLVAEGTPPPKALTDGFGLAFWVASGFAAAALIATALMLRSDDLREHPGAVGEL